MAEDEHEAYWREQHPKQPYAKETSSYDDYAHAYRAGTQAAKKYEGKKFDDIERDLKVDYERNRVEPGLAWEEALPAVRAAWDRIGGVIAPRDTDRGTRSGF